MASVGGSKVSTAVQPKPEDYDYDLDRALASVVSLHSIVPADAFTAETLGTERGGNAVLIRENVALTIGYLIMEAESIWLTTNEGKVVPGHVLAYDQETGFGLVQVLGRLDLPVLALGRSSATPAGERVVVAGAGGRQHSVAARIIAKPLANRGPADRADLRAGDIVLAVAGTEVSDLAGLFRRIWSLGRAGVEVPLLVYRDGRTFEVRVPSGDRNRFLKGPSLH